MQKRYRWNEQKNRTLQRERAISFEEIIEAIASGGLLEILEHPNRQKFRRQKLFIVRCRDYVYVVPFVETDEEIFLKTIIPSRKHVRRLRGRAQKQTVH